MAKRIEYIEPVSAVRGDLSAAQRLAYAENNNDAYFSPVGKRNQARNYKSRYLGMKDADTGRTRYAVRDKYTINMTPAAKRAMALMGSTMAIYAALLKSSLAADARECYLWYKEHGQILDTTSMRAFWCDIMYRNFRAHFDSIHWIWGTSGEIDIDNIFEKPDANITIKPALLVKFFAEMNHDPKAYTIDGMQGIFSGTMQFGEIIASEWNVLGLSIISGAHNDYVSIGGAYLLNPDGTYVFTGHYIVNGRKYTTTAIAP